MKAIKSLLPALLLAALVPAMATAQSRGALRINEVMVVNDNSVVDEYGQPSAWIELFNSAFAPLQISSVYLTTDSLNPKMYPVPLGDVNTLMPKRQHVIFWADGKPSRGTFHTNFTLAPDRENWIGIYDADGKTLLDQVVVPVMQPGQSYARKADGESPWSVRTGLTDHDYITPSSANVINDTNDRVDLFHERDKSGGALTIMAMCIVFSALLLLCLSFMLISKIGSMVTRHNKMKAQGISKAETSREDYPHHDSGEEIAAIVMALHEHLDAHDAEHTVLTINKVKKAYSPWNSKIYNMRQLPQR